MIEHAQVVDRDDLVGNGQRPCVGRRPQEIIFRERPGQQELFPQVATVNPVDASPCSMASFTSLNRGIRNISDAYRSTPGQAPAFETAG